MVSIYFSILYSLNLFIIKLIFWKNHSFLACGFYMKHSQNKIIYLMSYNSSSFDDMKFLAYGVSRYYVTLWLPKWRHLPFKNFVTPFKFDLYGIEKIYANFDALVIIWTIIDFNSLTIERNKVTNLLLSLFAKLYTEGFRRF